jgi:hypothetical protein
LLKLASNWRWNGASLAWLSGDRAMFDSRRPRCTPFR